MYTFILYITKIALYIDTSEEVLILKRSYIVSSFSKSRPLERMCFGIENPLVQGNKARLAIEKIKVLQSLRQPKTNT